MTVFLQIIFEGLDQFRISILFVISRNESPLFFPPSLALSFLLPNYANHDGPKGPHIIFVELAAEAGAELILLPEDGLGAVGLLRYYQNIIIEDYRFYF